MPSDAGRYERELVNALRDAGLGAMRAPSSGSATEADIADVVIGTPAPARPYSELWFTEHKKSGTPRAYFKVEKIEGLERVAARWGGHASAAARFTQSVDGRDKLHYFVPTSELEQVSEERFRIHADDAREIAVMIVNASEGEVRRI